MAPVIPCKWLESTPWVQAPRCLTPQGGTETPDGVWEARPLAPEHLTWGGKPQPDPPDPWARPLGACACHGVHKGSGARPPHPSVPAPQGGGTKRGVEKAPPDPTQTRLHLTGGVVSRDPTTEPVVSGEGVLADGGNYVPSIVPALRRSLRAPPGTGS